MLESADGKSLQSLPFFPLEAAQGGNPAFYSQLGNELGDRRSSRVEIFSDETIQRKLCLGSDTWTAGDLTFRILTPARSVPDPLASRVDQEELRLAVLPAVLVEVIVDCTASSRARRVVFGRQGSERQSGARRMDAASLPLGVVGIAHGLSTGIATDFPGARAAQGFALGDVLSDTHLGNRTFALGDHGVIIADVPPGKVTALRFAVAFYRGGRVTSGIDTKYLYTQFFGSLESVAAAALQEWPTLHGRAVALDAELEASALSADQRFQLAHAVHSYYGSTQLLVDSANRPVWVVNEGTPNPPSKGADSSSAF
jgi:hypothetical protein